MYATTTTAAATIMCPYDWSDMSLRTLLPVIISGFFSGHRLTWICIIVIAIDCFFLFWSDFLEMMGWEVIGMTGSGQWACLLYCDAFVSHSVTYRELTKCFKTVFVSASIFRVCSTIDAKTCKSIAAFLPLQASEGGLTKPS
jgi:hypothetical protein